MTRPYNKPPTTYEKQVEILTSRGIVIDDIEEAKFYLEHLNYYRLCAYWLPFETNHATHTFKPGTTFKEVLRLYIFDRELRLILLDAIERIEVSTRAHWSYFMAHNHGAHAYLDRGLVKNSPREQANYNKNLADLTKEVERADEVFITHYFNTYNAPALPPIWAACEVMSLGLLSRWYQNLISGPTKRAIASKYGLNEDLMESWIHHISIIRNLCAHHQRLWNRSFAMTPATPITKPRELANQFNNNSRNLYNALLILLFFMDKIAPEHTWRKKLVELLLEHEDCLVHMGFPNDWKTKAIWAA